MKERSAKNLLVLKIVEVEERIEILIYILASGPDNNGAGDGEDKYVLGSKECRGKSKEGKILKKG